MITNNMHRLLFTLSTAILALFFVSACATEFEIMQRTEPDGFQSENVFLVSGYGRTQRDAVTTEEKMNHSEARAREDLTNNLIERLTEEYLAMSDSDKQPRFVRNVIKDNLDTFTEYGGIRHKVFDEDYNCYIRYEIRLEGLRSLFVNTMKKNILFEEGEGWVDDTTMRVFVSSVADESIEDIGARTKALTESVYEEGITKMSYLIGGSYIKTRGLTNDADTVITTVEKIIRSEDFEMVELLLESYDDFKSCQAVYELSGEDMRTRLFDAIDSAL